MGTFPNGFGGGILNSDGRLTLEGCTVSGNSAYSFGGGVYSHTDDGSAVVLISNSTVSGNSARSGGGVFSRNEYGGTLTFSRSLISATPPPAGPRSIITIAAASSPPPTATSSATAA